MKLINIFRADESYYIKYQVGWWRKATRFAVYNTELKVFTGGPAEDRTKLFKLIEDKVNVDNQSRI